MIWSAAALLWGFSEATLFILVPDVLLTLAVVRLGTRRALGLSVWTLAGALAGGAAMHRWGAADPAAAVAMLDRIPAISAEMIARVRALAGGTADMIHGSLTGVPYKVFALASGAEGTPLPLFVLQSVAARLLRWLLLIGLTAGIVALMRRKGVAHRALALWAMLWTGFYGVYFCYMPG